MWRRRIKRGRVAAAVSVLAWSALVVIIPLAISLSTDDQRPGAVVAASSDQFGLTSPLSIDLFGLSMTAERGTVSMLGTGAARETRASLRQSLGAGAGWIAAEGMTFTFGTRPGRDATPAEDGFDPALLTALSAMQFDTLVVRRATVIVPIAAARTERLTNVALEVKRRKTGITFKGSGDLRGIPHALEGSLGSSDKRPPAALPFRLSIDGLLVKATLDGRLQPLGGPIFAGQMDLAIATGQPALMGLRAIAGSLPKSTGPEFDVVRIRGEGEWSAGAVALDKATVNFRGQEAIGAVHVGIGPERTKCSATLAAKSLDAVELLKADRTKSVALETVDRIAGQIATWISAGRSAPEPGIDADLRISTGRITGLPLGTGSAAISIVMQAGQLDAEISELTYAGGRASSQIAIDFNRLRPVATVRARVDGADLAALSTAAIGQPLLQGTGLVSMDLRSEGLTADALSQSLDGQVTLVQKDGGRLGLDLKALAALAGRPGVVGWPALRGGTTFDQLDGQLSIRGGSATIDTLTLKQADTTVSLTGGIGFASSRLFVDILVPETSTTTAAAAVPPGETDVAVIELRGSLGSPEATARRRHRPDPGDGPSRRH